MDSLFEQETIKGDPLASLWERAFTFRDRPTPVAADLRIVWRLPLLLMTLHFSRQRQSSLERLHVLNWAFRTPRARALIESVVEGKRRPGDVVVRADTTLDQLLAFAAAEGLVALSEQGRAILTTSGESLVAEVLATDDCLADERAHMPRLAKAVTEKWVNQLVRVRPSPPSP